MSLTLSLLSIVGALTLGTISPGPSFVMVARTSVAQSRRHGLYAALGMGVGGTVFAVAALLGLQALLAAVPRLHLLMQLAGGAYLMYLGLRIWQGAKEEIITSNDDGKQPELSRARFFNLALATQLSNPKAAIVYASVFAALLPPEVPGMAFVLVPLVVFLIETGWYALVAVGLSAPAARSAYLRYKIWIDRTAGGVMELLGAKLLLSAAGD